MKTIIPLCALILALVTVIAADSPSTDAGSEQPSKGFWGSLGRIFKGGTNRTAASSAVAISDLSPDQISRGLKEALGRGLNQAVSQLGKDGGFLNNANVRIPIPERLQTVEKIMRRAGQDKLADDFIASMNHAAEQAVPAAAEVFADSLKEMTVDDARAILKGPNDAATDYFRRKAGPQLEERFKPVVSKATAKTGVTSAYKKMVDRATFASTLFKDTSLDLDDYVTTRATDGLFKVVAEEERKIRENPVERTTDLLRTVFGAVRK